MQHKQANNDPKQRNHREKLGQGLTERCGSDGLVVRAELEANGADDDEVRQCAMEREGWRRSGRERGVVVCLGLCFCIV